MFWRNNIEQMVNIYQIFGRFYLTINDFLLVLPGNDQDLDHENIVNTYLYYQVCKVNDIICFRDQYLWPNHCQIFHKNLIETPVLGRNVWR